ncbi:response regulator [Haladaptatus salinisoli]|uniref:response regulator n=1 Tax=Haladaptatus salinisoli TaxID=2884876 RepID=UPI001D0A3A3D|nr:response regulator [Haladaptatus salinisoli]
MERRPVRVLHVEDNEFFATVASNVLREEHPNVTVHTENHPTEALARLEREQFDCVVSDYEMPEMNGLELLDAVRRASPEIPFILMTGGGSEETASEAISAGVTDYLRKGTGRRQFVALANRIENAVSHRRAERAVRRQLDINDLIWDVSQSLLEATTREEIEESVCERLAGSESYLHAWIGDVDDGKVVPRVSAETEGGCSDAAFRDETTGAESESASRAVELGEIRINRNVAADSPERRWEQTLERDYCCRAAIPLQYGDSVYGVLNVYADHPHAFDETERRVLSKFGNSVAYAINSIRTRQELLRREQRLQVFNRILRHNLRNDLNVVLGHADNLVESIPETAESAEIIKRKATELIDVSEKAREIGETLDRKSKTRTTTEITGIVERACSDLRESYPNVKLTADLPDAAWVYGDKTLDTVVNEILENAVEHNDRENPIVTIAAATVESNRGKWIDVTVTDDGPGIPKEERSVLSEGRETALQHGSGLGLWLTNWVVGKFGGELAFDSNRPRGSAVTIRLPSAEPSERR